MKETLNIKNITKSYNNRLILDNVSFSLNSGEIVGLFGPNGAGKTTCFSIIIGLIKADYGSLFYNIHDITNLPIYIRAKFGFGYLPQESSIFRGLSVSDNIKLVLEILYKDKEEIEEKIIDLLSEFHILHLKNVKAVSLSGGERRRLEIARTLATNPKFIMLDEPLAGIDPLAVEDIKGLLSHLKDRNIGVLITDHNVKDILGIVDRAYVMYDGKILFDGTGFEVASSEIVRDLYLGQSFSL